MSTKSLLITFMLFVSGLAFSQTEHYTIQLKNGTTVKGTLGEKIPGETIVIRAAENEELKMAQDDIQETTNTALQEKSNNKEVDSIPPYNYKKRGFINYTEVNFSQGFGEVSNAGTTNKNTNRSFGIRTVNGFQFSEYFSVGLGVGLEKYSTKDLVLVPVTLDLRFTFKKGKTSPTFNINIGGAPNIETGKEGGGFVVNPSFGIKTYVSHKTAFFFNVGYKIQQDSYEFKTGMSNETISYSAMLKYVNFTAGFAF